MIQNIVVKIVKDIVDYLLVQQMSRKIKEERIMKDFKIFDKVLCLIVHLVEEIQDLIEVILQELDGNRNKIGVILI